VVLLAAAAGVPLPGAVRAAVEVGRVSHGGGGTERNRVIVMMVVAVAVGVAGLAVGWAVRVAAVVVAGAAAG